MRRIGNSLLGKITLILVVLLVFLGGAQVLLTVDSCELFLKEADEHVNLILARTLATRLKPHISSRIDPAGVTTAMAEIRETCPDLALYLLDRDGRILESSPSLPGGWAPGRVDPAPIRRYIAHTAAPAGRRAAVVGDDPAQPGKLVPFVAAAIEIDTAVQGYVYIVLPTAAYPSGYAMVTESYIGRTMLRLVGLALLFAAISGFLLFRFTTRRHRAIIETVRQFEAGDLDRRIPLNGNDEINRLAGTFNQMADTLASNIERLRDHDRQRRELVSNISHDLRGPLATIQGYLETILLQDDRLTATRRKEYFHTVLRNTTRLNKLVDALFELSRLDAGQVQLAPEPFCLADLVQDVVLQYQPMAAARGINFHFDIAERLPRVVGDIAMIERALTSLLENAIQCSPQDGDITLSISNKDDVVGFKIMDSGGGIPEEDLPHVFDRFYRVEKSRPKPPHGGAGLGLAITRKIIEAHNSVISVSSQPHSGTVFQFTLPAYSR